MTLTIKFGEMLWEQLYSILWGGEIMETLEAITTFISGVGFPIAVAVYSLVRLEKSMRENTAILTKLYERMDKV